jgi:hypothetical protein
MSHTSVPRGVVLLALLAALSFGSMTQLAFANHWHTVNNRAHGLEHGSSTSDGSFFGRTYGYYIGDTNYCYVGDVDRGLNYGTVTYNADLCSVWSWAYYVTIDECRGVTYNEVSGYNGISGHNHYAHNWGSSCPVSSV